MGDEVVRCWDCKRPLDPTDALTCVECSAHQNWRRHIALSQATLALVVALLSVLTVVIPVMAKVFDDDRSRISLEPLRLRPSRLGDIDTFQIEAQVANVGKRAGVIRAVLIQFKKDVGCGANESVRSCGDTVLPVGSCELVYQLKGAPVETPTSRLVEPNQVEVAELHYLLNNGLKYDDVPSAWRKLYADVRNSDGSKECLTVDVRSVMN